VVVVELESCGGPSSDYGASGVVVNGVLVVLAPEEACAVGFLPNRDAVHHPLRMVCQHVSPILGARSVMMILRLFWPLVVWILSHPASFNLPSCERNRSVVLWVAAVLSVLWMCLWVYFFHLLWSSLVRGSCELRVVCCRMLRHVIWCSFMLCLWLWMVMGMWCRCQSACFAALMRYGVYRSACWCSLCMSAQGMPPWVTFSQIAVRSTAASAFRLNARLRFGAEVGEVLEVGLKRVDGCVLQLLDEEEGWDGGGGPMPPMAILEVFGCILRWGLCMILVGSLDPP
jgi:hypothetical protein